ncbi:MAG: alpha/beta hydrolase fold domain-containing protein, partial [Anaerolineae bacterium]|nr:alpha/beta hydrolase fold domain-containing protein [Anaerolineae bacterium]
MSRHTWLLRGVFAGLVVSALEAGRAFQPSLRSRAVYRALRLFRVRELLAQLDLQGDMPDTGRIMRPPEGVAVQPLTVAGRYAEWLIPADAASDSVILYLHGGAYVTGSAQLYRSMAGRLAAASGMRALTLDYRLAPRYPFPAALDDAIAAYQWLVAQGFKPGQITFAGDSAGGGLALAALLHLRDSNISLPAGAALLSPWMDLTGAGESMAALADRDPMLSWAMLDPAAAAYTAGTPRDH